VIAENQARTGTCRRASKDYREPVRPYRRDVWTRTIVDHVSAQAPELRNSFAIDPHREITLVVKICLDWSISRLQGTLTIEDIDRLQAVLASWAGDGIGIDAVLHGVHEGFRAGMDLMFAQRRSTTSEEVRAVTGAVLELLRVVTATVGKSYVREYRAQAIEHQVGVHTLTSALLRGKPTSTMATTFGALVAERYHVLAVSMPSHPDEANPDLNGQVVARRKLRRLQAALALHTRAAPLSLLSVDGGTILVPCAKGDTDTMTDELVDKLSAAAQVPLRVATVVADAADVPVAVGHAHELLDTADQLGQAPGVYRFEELALQYQLTRPGEARDRLAGQLAVLDEHPELLETLRAHIGTGLRRQATAKLLHLHPNTVDYRLRRIGELTGLDPSSSTGLWHLRSAMIARAGTSCEPR